MDGHVLIRGASAFILTLSAAAQCPVDHSANPPFVPLGRVRCIVKWLCSLCLAVSAFAADTPVVSLIKTVEQRYNHTDSLQVFFRQSYTKAGRTRPTEAGLLDLRKPGRMRWDYSDPKGKLVVYDGKTLWTYTPSENTAREETLNETDTLQGPIAFLLGKLHFDKEFKNIRGTPEGEDMRITAEPKSDKLPYIAVEFLVAAPEGRIRAVKVTGFDNGVTEWVFNREDQPQIG